MKLIYIGHPLTGSSPDAKRLGWGDPAYNVERYLRFAAMATNQGHVVVSWIHHYLLHERGLTDGDEMFYLERDAALIRMADEFWQAGPMEASSGLVYELKACKEYGIPVIHRGEWDDPLFMP
tara:strand:- start:339 stop:704 length:366 start_codon:yes stop_codon:yes gene_type:complete